MMPPLCVILLLYKLLGHNCEMESTGGCQSENIDELTEVGILLPLLIKANVMPCWTIRGSFALKHFPNI